MFKWVGSKKTFSNPFRAKTAPNIPTPIFIFQHVFMQTSHAHW